MLQSLRNLQAVDLGFRPGGLLTLRTTLPDSRYDRSQRQQFSERVLAGVKQLPGVVDAGFGSTLPFLSRGNTAGFRLEGRASDPAQPPDALFRITTVDYLRTLGVRLLEGRLPEAGDGADTAPIAIVTQSFADTHGQGSSLLGQRLHSPLPTRPG
jgi:hypothetical protein